MPMASIQLLIPLQQSQRDAFKVIFLYYFLIKPNIENRSGTERGYSLVKYPLLLRHNIYHINCIFKQSPHF